METTDVVSDRLEVIVGSAIARTGIESAVVFVVDPVSSDLVLGAAAGIDGIALGRLAGAVRDPAHPIARTLADGLAAFDVKPMAPGGPALRSHLPLLLGAGGARRPVGVLAVAHEFPLEAEARQALIELADQAAAAIASTV